MQKVPWCLWSGVNGMYSISWTPWWSPRYGRIQHFSPLLLAPVLLLSKLKKMKQMKKRNFELNTKLASSYVLYAKSSTD